MTPPSAWDFCFQLSELLKLEGPKRLIYFKDFINASNTIQVLHLELLLQHNIKSLQYLRSRAQTTTKRVNMEQISVVSLWMWSAVSARSARSHVLTYQVGSVTEHFSTNELRARLVKFPAGWNMVGHVYRVNTGYRMDTCSNISAEFVQIKCAEHDHTLHTVNTEFETTTLTKKYHSNTIEWY